MRTLSVRKLFTLLHTFVKATRAIHFGMLTRVEFRIALVNLPRKGSIERAQARVVFGWEFGYVVVRLSDTADILLVGPGTSYQKLITELEEECPIEVPIERTKELIDNARRILGKRFQDLAEFARRVKESQRSKKSH
jgi:hypothetical protein